MSKENRLLLFMAVVVTMAVMFATTNVMAQICADTWSVSAGNGKYTLTVEPCLDTGGELGEETFPCRVVLYNNGVAETWYQYSYTLDNDDVDHIYITVPYRADDPILINLWVDGSIKYWPPGVGDGGVGEGEYNVRVLTIPPTTNRVTYYADRIVRGGVSAFFAKGKFTYEGNNCISGVGYEAGGVVVGSTIEYEALIAGSPSICVREHIGPDGCVEQLDYGCFDPDDDEECPGSITSWQNVPSETVEATYIGASGFDQKCPGAWDIRDLQGSANTLCGDSSTASFMDFLDFLGPSPAYAGSKCPNGCCNSRYSRGKLYCLQCCP